MDYQTVDYREHRREPRVNLSWPSSVQPALGGARRSFTTVNISADGICMCGEFGVSGSNGNESNENRANGRGENSPFLLDLAPPSGARLEEIEIAPVWERFQDEKVLSGWRFVGLHPEIRLLLQGEVGLRPPMLEYDPWEEDEIELWDYVKVLIKQRWLIACCTVLTALIAWGFVATQPAEFRAQAQAFSVGEVDNLMREEFSALRSAPFVAILQSVPLSQRMLNKPYTILLPDSSQMARTLVEWSVARGVEWDREETEEALALPLDGRRQRQREAGALGWLRSMAEFEQSKDGILTINVVAEFPELAEQIANNYVEELDAYQLRTSTGHTAKSLLMAQSRMDTLQRELKAAEGNLKVFKVANQNLLRDMREVRLLFPKVGNRLDSLQREIDLKRRLYLTVAEQYELLRLQREKDATEIEVINYAEPPLRPEDKTQKFVVLGAAVGAFTGIFLAFFLEYLSSKREAGELTPLIEAWHQDIGRLRRLCLCYRPKP